MEGSEIKKNSVNDGSFHQRQFVKSFNQSQSDWRHLGFHLVLVVLYNGQFCFFIGIQKPFMTLKQPKWAEDCRRHTSVHCLEVSSKDQFWSCCTTKADIVLTRSKLKNRRTEKESTTISDASPFVYFWIYHIWLLLVKNHDTSRQCHTSWIKGAMTFRLQAFLLLLNMYSI